MASSSSKDITATAKATATLQIRVARETHDFWKLYYKQIDTEMAQRAMEQEKPTVDYDEQTGRYATTVRLQFQDAYAKFERCFNPYATGFNQIMVSTITKMETRAVSDAVMAAYRYADLRKEALDDIRWTRMLEVSGIGRGMLTTSMSYASSAGKGAAGLARQVDQSTAEALKGVGYILDRSFDNRKVPNYKYKSPQQPTMAGDLAARNQYNGGSIPGTTQDSSGLTQSIGGVPLTPAQSDASLLDTITSFIKGI